MAKQVVWTKPVLEDFIRLALMDERQEAVIRLHASGKSQVEICMQLNISESTLNRIIRELKDRYDEVQPHSEIMKPRQKDANKLKEVRENPGY